MSSSNSLMLPLKRHAVLMAGLFCALTIVGYLLYVERHRSWASIPSIENVDTNVKQHVINLLQKGHESNSRIRPGFSQLLITVRTASRKQIAIYAAEANLTDSSIENMSWNDLTSDGALLVNSVDELRRNDGGISRRIAAGCKLKSPMPNHAPMQVGELIPEPCGPDAPYQKYGIKEVANIAIVLWRDDPGKARCDVAKAEISTETGYATNTEYKKCISDSIRSGLRKLFSPRQDGKLTLSYRHYSGISDWHWRCTPRGCLWALPRDH